MPGRCPRPRAPPLSGAVPWRRQRTQARMLPPALEQHQLRRWSRARLALAAPREDWVENGVAAGDGTGGAPLAAPGLAWATGRHCRTAAGPPPPWFPRGSHRQRRQSAAPLYQLAAARCTAACARPGLAPPRGCPRLHCGRCRQTRGPVLPRRPQAGRCRALRPAAAGPPRGPRSLGFAAAAGCTPHGSWRSQRALRGAVAPRKRREGRGLGPLQAHCSCSQHHHGDQRRHRHRR